MTWSDRFQEGSFRGVPFLITSAPRQIGRRQEMHEYPGRDTPWTEDLGRSGRRWQIECFVIGPDYDLARNALEAALEKPGPGTLIHPYLGTLQASAGVATVVDSTAEGGMASFSIPFLEAGVDAQPSVTPDTGVAAGAAAASVRTASLNNVGANLTIPGSESFITPSALSVLSSAATAIRLGIAAVNGDPLAAFGLLQQVAGLGGAGALADVGSLVGTVFDVVAGISDVAAASGPALVQLTGLIDFGASLPAVPLTTPSRIVQAGNQTALVLLVQCAAAAAAVNTVAGTTFSSYDEAAGVRDPLADQLDGLATAISVSGDDALAAAMDALRLAMVVDVTARGASLARLYSYTPATTEPALVIAQRLYGDAAQADDIIARNAPPRPAFMTGGLPIQVLNVAS
jgi:prophage DNA circulation protein